VHAFCGQGWRVNSSDSDSALFGAKILGFPVIYGVSARTRGRGVKPVKAVGRKFSKERGGQRKKKYRKLAKSTEK